MSKGIAVTDYATGLTHWVIPSSGGAYLSHGDYTNPREPKNRWAERMLALVHQRRLSLPGVCCGFNTWNKDENADASVARITCIQCLSQMNHIQFGDYE
jgi:hypothetical protein